MDNTNAPRIADTNIMPSQWFGELRSSDPPEKRLWYAVLVDALRCISYTGEDKKRLRDQREARAWLVDSPDCAQVFEDWFEVDYSRFRVLLLERFRVGFPDQRALPRTHQQGPSPTPIQIRLQAVPHGRAGRAKLTSQERDYKRAVGQYVASGNRRRNQDSDW